MYKLIKTALLLIFVFLTTFLKAQDIQITLTDINTLLVNNIAVDELDEEKVQELFGQPTQIKTSESSKDYFYENLGLVVSIEDKEVKAIGINYNWDGDEKFPQTLFTGTLLFGDKEISVDSERDVFSNSQIIEMNCIAEVICMSKSKESNIKIVAGFKDNKITQIAFRF